MELSMECTISCVRLEKGYFKDPTRFKLANFQKFKKMIKFDNR